MAGAPDQWSYLSLLDEDPQLAYFSQLYGGGEKLSQNQSSYFGNQGFGDIWNQYLGSQGTGLKKAYAEGKDFPTYMKEAQADPNNSWTNYLGNVPFQQRWGQMSPSQRPGGSTQRFAPSTRWIG